MIIENEVPVRPTFISEKVTVTLQFSFNALWIELCLVKALVFQIIKWIVTHQQDMHSNCFVTFHFSSHSKMLMNG